MVHGPNLSALSVLSVLSVLSALSCLPFRAAERGEPQRPAVVHVRNDNWLDVAIYAVRDGARYRIGDVGTCNAVELRIPHGALGAGDLVLEVNPIGSLEVYRTPSLFVTGGTYIDLWVSNVLRQSSFAVRTEGDEGTD